MNELQEGLKELRDIHEPVSISGWPPAPGWWMLPILILVIYFIVRAYIKYRRTPKYKKLATQELGNIQTNYEIHKKDGETVGEISLLIRKVLVAKHGNQAAAGLIGGEWLAYLDKQSNTKLFSEGAGQVLVTVPYGDSGDTNIDELILATKKLIRRL